MHSSKYIAVLALLGVGSVMSRQQRRTLSQLKAQLSQEKCATGAPSYREASGPSNSYYEASSSAPSYASSWNAWYEEPTVSLYTYEESSGSYVPAREWSPSVSYFFYSEATDSYRSYQPTSAVWTEYYEAPSVSLYWREPSTQTYE